MSHNGKLTSLLEESMIRAERAKDESDLLQVVKRIEKFKAQEGDIAYSHVIKIFFIFLGTVLNGIFWYLFFNEPVDMMSELFNDNWIFFGGIAVGLAALLITPIAMLFGAESRIKKLSDLIFNKDILFDNNMRELNIDGEETYAKLNKTFGGFNRGDEDRTIEMMIGGEHETIGHFRLYKFSYVVVTTVSTGKTTTQIHTTYYRYGLLCTFPFTQSIAINADDAFSYKKRWKSTDSDFNRRFKATAEDDMAIAKFLKPTVVLAFNELPFKDITFEVNSGDMLNISFTDEDVFTLDRKYSVKEPELFRKEIESFLGLPKLKLLLAFIEKLIEHNDSNF